jgi:hypothetical protein
MEENDWKGQENENMPTWRYQFGTGAMGGVDCIMRQERW